VEGSSGRSCLIIGAGISGLLAARELAASGWSVTVLDKGLGVGGRMATRRVGDGTFDHGAQFFTVRSERFGSLVEGWLEAGLVREWSRGFADAEGNRNEDGHPRYVCAGGMTGLCKHLAEGLAVHRSERVVEVGSGDSIWEVACESGLEAGAGALLVTAPAPQAFALVEGVQEVPEEAREALRRVAYDPCLALMVLLRDGPSPVPEPGGMQIKGEPLDWISDNGTKGISQAPALTIHAGPRWSREHYDLPEPEVTDRLLLFASERLGHDLRARLRETSLARWRYSWVKEPHPDPCLVALDEPPLLFAGDGFGSPKVEGAALSGLAAADRLLGRGS
jgi:predicted NAD/FAD-dependent oxidoreductase